jgi:hypothetical protein
VFLQSLAALAAEEKQRLAAKGAESKADSKSQTQAEEDNAWSPEMRLKLYKEQEEKKVRDEEARQGASTFTSQKSAWKEALDKVTSASPAGPCLSSNPFGLTVHRDVFSS